MALRTCSNEALLPRLRSVVNVSFAGYGRDGAARLDHQKFARRQIPVVPLAHRDGRIEPSRRDMGQPQLQGQGPAHVLGDAKMIELFQRLAVPGNASTQE